MSMANKPGRPPGVKRSRHAVTDGGSCSYSHRACTQPRLDGFDFCMKHILEDKNSPYKQCNYMSNKTGKRCSNAAPKSDKREGYCADHTKKALLLRQRACKRARPRETPESLLEELDAYGHRGDNHSADGIRRARSVDNIANKIMDYASSSDSELDSPTVDNGWKGDGDSDAESVDSEQEDYLKHAGVYTAEEVALITRDKLIRLQSLYIDQFKRLQHVMKEKRRKYLRSVKHERDALGSIHNAKDDPDQREKYDMWMAMKRYHKRHGKEALLHRQSKERRIEVSEGTNYKPLTYPKCIYNRVGLRCGARTIPLSKYCFNHILHDPHQTLFQQCNYGNACTRPIGAVSDTASCPYHAQPELVDYRWPNKKDRENEDSKDDIQIDVVGEDAHLMERQSQQLQLQLKKEIEDLELKAAELTARSSGNNLNNLSQQELPKQLLAPSREPSTDEREETAQPASQSQPMLQDDQSEQAILQNGVKPSSSEGMDCDGSRQSVTSAPDTEAADPQGLDETSPEGVTAVDSVETT